MKTDGLVSAGTTTLAVGLLLRYKGRDAGPPLRITHLFNARIYVMAYTAASGARAARRPRALGRRDVEKDLKARKCGIYRVELPEELYRARPVSEQNNTSRKSELRKAEQTDEIAFEWISPLVKKFDVESNLNRGHFKALVQKRADELKMSYTTVARTLLRFYYFGRVREGLTPLVPGPDPGTSKAYESTDAKRAPKRRGRQPVLAAEFGHNTFVVSNDDIEDMIKAAKSTGRNKSDLTTAHDEYMRVEFAKRHQKEFDDFIKRRCVLPVTERQFAIYTKAHAEYEQEVLDNIPALAGSDPGRSVLASGIGEIYEADATGGRVDVVSKETDGEAVLLRNPWIYMMIDRWSRFIVAVYVTLNAPAWEELKYLLLLAFTPRAARFRCLGMEVDESRWPRARAPCAIAHDRGSDLKSIANLKASVEGLKMESLTMPPQTPNARLIERAIRELKRNMARSGLRSVYAERPTDPKSKRVAKPAQRAAASSLRDVYRCVLKVVDEHNNNPTKP